MPSRLTMAVMLQASSTRSSSGMSRAIQPPSRDSQRPRWLCASMAGKCARRTSCCSTTRVGRGAKSARRRSLISLEVFVIAYVFITRCTCAHRTVWSSYDLVVRHAMTVPQHVPYYSISRCILRYSDLAISSPRNQAGRATVETMACGAVPSSTRPRAFVCCHQTGEKGVNAMRFHRIFWSLVLCALVMLPASVASARSHRATANLTFALWDKYQIPAMQKIITKFQQLHPDVRITIQQTPWAGYWNKLATLTAGGSSYDVFWMNGPSFPTYASKGALLDLTPYLRAARVDLSRY